MSLLNNPPNLPSTAKQPNLGHQPNLFTHGVSSRFLVITVNGVSSSTAPQLEPSVTDVLPPAIRSNFVIGVSSRFLVITVLA